MCQDTTLLHTIEDGEELRQVVVESDLAELVLMQLDHNLKELGGTAEPPKDQPETFPADGVKAL